MKLCSWVRGAALLVAAASVWTLTPGAAARSRPETGQTAFNRAFARLFAQPRFEVNERIVADPYVSQHFRVRWIAPDRLRTDMYDGINLHIGDIGCINGSIWVCGPDKAPPRPEARSAVLSALFPRKLVSGNCCLSHLHCEIGDGAGQVRYVVITALGDPWLNPLGCLGCDLPGSSRIPVASMHYRAVLTLDRSGRPTGLRSVVTLDAGSHRRSPRTIRVQDVIFAYSGTWAIDVPRYPRIHCRSWDRTSGSWCMRVPPEWGGP